MEQVMSLTPAELELIVTMRRHLHGMQLALEALEARAAERSGSQPDGARAAQQARSDEMVKVGPHEAKAN